MRLSNEATLASAVSIGREVASDAEVTLREVQLSHPRPKEVKLHIAYIGCPLIFGSDRHAILFTNMTLDRSNKLGDQGITRFLLGHLKQELAAVARESNIKDRIRDLIARSLSEGLPRMDDIARRLGISGRSLHRRLSADEFSFQALAEAFVIADNSNIERQQLFDVMFAGPLGSPFMEFMAAYALEGNPNKLAFSIRNAAKDVGYYDQMTKEAGTPSIMAGGALGALNGAVEAGRGDALVPELLDYFTERLGRG